MIEIQGSSIPEKIDKSLHDAEGLYERLVLLVGETGSGKSTILREVAKKHETSVININLKLSAELLELTERQRTLKLPEALERVIGCVSSLIVLDNLEILFDKSLRQDPLRLLQALARNRIVIASWGGIISLKRLVYAEIGHSEYRSYGSPEADEVLIVDINSITAKHSSQDN